MQNWSTSAFVMLLLFEFNAMAASKNMEIAQYCGLAPTCSAKAACNLASRDLSRDERSCDARLPFGISYNDAGCEAKKATNNAQLESTRRIQLEEYRYCLAVEQKERVNCEIARTDWDLCNARTVRADYRIDQPNVNIPAGVDTDIVLLAGDQIRIEAGGCVQTGGRGKTWKRYVNPIPEDKHYGTIRIAGIIQETKISNVLSKRIDIPASAHGAKLHLGYVDSHYADNGYYAHDDGVEGQCKDLPDAFFRVVITQAVRLSGSK